MATIRKILLAVDFGAASEAATLRATELARVFDAEITVLHVYEAPVYAYPHPPHPLLDVDAISASLERRAQAGVDVIVRQIAHHTGRVSGFVRQGSAWRNINDVAREVDADLVVMGTHGRTGVDRVLIGSVAEKVVRTSPVPVLIVPEPHAPPAVSEA